MAPRDETKMRRREDRSPRMALIRQGSEAMRDESVVRIPWKSRIKRYTLSEFFLCMKIAFDGSFAVLNAAMIVYDIILMGANESDEIAQMLWFNVLDAAIGFVLVFEVVLRMWLQWTTAREYFEVRANAIDVIIGGFSLLALPLVYVELEYPEGTFYASWQVLASLRAFRDLCRLGRQFYFVKWTYSCYIELRIVHEGYIDVDDAQDRQEVNRASDFSEENRMSSPRSPAFQSLDSPARNGTLPAMPSESTWHGSPKISSTESMWMQAMADASNHSLDHPSTSVALDSTQNPYKDVLEER